MGAIARDRLKYTRLGLKSKRLSTPAFDAVTKAYFSAIMFLQLNV